MNKALTLVIGALTALLTACGGNGNTPDPNGGNTGELTGIKKQLAGCKEASTPSQDITMMSCLAAKYSGKTADGSACSVDIAANGNYSFTSSALTYTYKVDANSKSFFSHIVNTFNGVTDRIILWQLNGQDGAGDTYELKANLSFGPNTLGKPSIEAHKTPANTTNSQVVNCLVDLS